MTLTKEKEFKTMREADVLDAIENNDLTASDLLREVMPTAATRFSRLTSNLHNLMEDIREHFPDAKLYSASGTVNLMLGDSHNMHEQAQQELVAETASKLTVEGGDW